jgi:imidazolonepropionase-like amidohydrolase
MERIASEDYNRAAGTPERAAVLTEAVVLPHRQTVQRAFEAGVPIAVGTDSTGDYTEELVRLTEVGMSPDEVLRAATMTGAAICRQPAGRIAAGLRGDLALHGADPLADITALTRPEYVVRGGRVVVTPEHGAA